MHLYQCTIKNLQIRQLCVYNNLYACNYCTVSCCDGRQWQGNKHIILPSKNKYSDNDHLIYHSVFLAQE